MEGLLLNPASKSDLKLLIELVKKMKIPGKILSEEEIEDLGLSLMMNDIDKSERVSRDTIMQKLNS